MTKDDESLNEEEVGENVKMKETKEGEEREEREHDDDDDGGDALKHAFLLFLRPPKRPSITVSNTMPNRTTPNTLCINGKMFVEIFLTKKQMNVWILLFRDIDTSKIHFVIDFDVDFNL